MNYQPSITEEAGKPADHKDSLSVEGVNPDYLWYETETLRKDVQGLLHRIEKFSKTVAERHAENLKLTLHLSDENRMLKGLLNQLGMRPATRKEKITNPGVYWVLDTNEESK